MLRIIFNWTRNPNVHEMRKINVAPLRVFIFIFLLKTIF